MAGLAQYALGKRMALNVSQGEGIKDFWKMVGLS